MLTTGRSQYASNTSRLERRYCCVRTSERLPAFRPATPQASFSSVRNWSYRLRLFRWVRRISISDQESRSAGSDIPLFPGKSLLLSGRISAWVGAESAYLVDGVAINGVSGGPAFIIDGATVIGVVSAYIPNRATGEPLPGLAVVRDVAEFHDLAQSFKSLDEAKAEETQPTEPPPPAPETESPIKTGRGST